MPHSSANSPEERYAANRRFISEHRATYPYGLEMKRGSTISRDGISGLALYARRGSALIATISDEWNACLFDVAEDRAEFCAFLPKDAWRKDEHEAKALRD